MRIMLTHRFFWPDSAPYGVLLRTLSRGIAHAGHQVEIFASQPSYQDNGASRGPEVEVLDGIAVTRCFVFAREKSNPVRRLVNAGLYCGALFVHILRRRPEVVSAATFPPVVAAATACLASRLVGAKFIYHVQDIHPEVSRVSDGRMGRGLLYRALRWLDNRTLLHAAAVVTLSQDMAQTLRARNVAIRKLVVSDNFDLEAFDDSPTDTAVPEPGTYIVMFAGNLGRFQDLPLLAEGVACCFESHPHLRLVFMGTGAMEASLKARWGDHPQVKFLPFRPFVEARPIMEGADLGVVSLVPGMTAVAKPSKLVTYEALGLPVFLLSDPDSALASEIRARGTGVTVCERTPEGVARALLWAMENPNLKPSAKTLAESLNRRTQAIDTWNSLIEELS